MKKAIHQVAAKILAEQGQPMSVEQIYEIVVARGLYEFKAKSPMSVLRSQLYRHSNNDTSRNKAKVQSIEITADGRFKLLSSGDPREH
ncbi:MAG: winged helix-turn-helix domain-containing protein [Planctomycetota bacterium]